MTPEQKLERKKLRDLKKKVDHNLMCFRSEKRRVAENDQPAPTRKYAIGDRVDYGAWDWTCILATYKGSRYYKCFSVTRKTNMNTPDYTDHKIHFENWYTLRDYRTHEELEALPRFEQDEDIHFSFQQRDVRSLLHQYLNKYGIDLNPDYQRGNVWTEEQQHRLIDSIYRNVDIGKFAVIKRPWGPDGNKPLTPKLYEMLDGKQRLTALIAFYLGHLAYKGKYYNELSNRDQGHFMNYSVSYAESNFMTQEQKYRYFLKLNTTGTPVDPAHMERVANLLKKEQAK